MKTKYQPSVSIRFVPQLDRSAVSLQNMLSILFATLIQIYAIKGSRQMAFSPKNPIMAKCLEAHYAFFGDHRKN